MANQTSSLDHALKLVQANRFAEALPLAQQAVDRSRTCSTAHALLATIYLRLGSAEQAMSVVQAGLQCEPGVADAYDALAFVSLQLGMHAQASELYQRAVA